METQGIILPLCTPFLRTQEVRDGQGPLNSLLLEEQALLAYENMRSFKLNLTNYL